MVVVLEQKENLFRISESQLLEENLCFKVRTCLWVSNSKQQFLPFLSEEGKSKERQFRTLSLIPLLNIDFWKIYLFTEPWAWEDEGWW